MKRFIITICALLLAVPALAQQVIVSGTTTTRVYFYVTDDTGAGETAASVSSVYYIKGNGSLTQISSPGASEVSDANAPGLWYFVANEGTTISSGLVEENIIYYINASGGTTAPVQAVVKDSQATVSDLADAVRDKAITMPSPGAIPATPTIGEALGYAIVMMRNPQAVDSGNDLVTIYDTDGTTELFTYTTGDTAGVFTRGIAEAPL